MKKNLYVISLSLSILLLSGCETETVIPAAVAENQAASAKTAPVACTTYSYESKTGTQVFGTASTTEVLVGFEDGLTTAQKTAILSQFKPFKAIAYEMATESGILTVISLKTNTTCQQVEIGLPQLQMQPGVRYALPAFDTGSIWNDFIVTLSTNGTERQLEQLALSTRTRIIGFPSEYGPKTYLLSSDKSSTMNIFDLLTYFNASNRVAFAEPNGYIFPLPQ